MTTGDCCLAELCDVDSSVLLEEVSAGDARNLVQRIQAKHRQNLKNSKTNSGADTATVPADTEGAEQLSKKREKELDTKYKDKRKGRSGAAAVGLGFPLSLAVGHGSS